MTIWNIGSVAITRVEEQLGITNQPCEKYFRNFERDVLERHLDWLAPDHYSIQHDRFVTSVHSWLVRLGGLTILIDTCGGNHKDRPWTPRFHQLDTPYLQRLRAAGAKPEDIDMVLCTHLHADHVGWNTMRRDGRWVPTFPNAKYLFSRTDDAYWDVRKNSAMAADPRHMAYEDSVLPVVQSGQAVLVDDGYNITSKLSVEAAPGHSPGHVLFNLADGGRRAVCFAETLFITRFRSMRRIGITWRTSGRLTPRHRAGGCWSHARSTTRCCFRSISARLMWRGSATAPRDSQRNWCLARVEPDSLPVRRRS
jgi:glyoxylase-like metal-dependent hydrolase (beta-lactamase superfamily II)